MESIFNKEKILTGVLLVGFIILLEWVLHHFSLPTWPVFMVMILVLMSHLDPKEVPKVLVGGLFGIFNIILIDLWMGLTSPALGLWGSQVAYIGILVFLIVLLMDAVPILFNTYLFMYFVVTALASRMPDPNPVLWMGCELIGGLVVVGGLLGLTKIIEAVCGESESHDDEIQA